MKVLLAVLAASLPGIVLAAGNSWSLASPDGRCVISVALDEQGQLNYQVSRAGKPVILKSPLGLRRDDQAFDRGLALQDEGKQETRRETYELFAGTCPRADHTLNRRSLVFRNTNACLLQLDLAAADEGVAFRYRFSETAREVHILEAELTGFAVSPAARGWLQPYHAASAYTPAYEDFYFNVAPGDPPPRSRENPVGWAFPALFHVADASTWALVTESGTDGSFCGCHLAPESSNGVYRVAFPLENEATRRHRNQFGPEPRAALPWTMPWRVIVMGKSAGDIALATLVTDLAPPARVAAYGMS